MTNGEKEILKMVNKNKLQNIKVFILLSIVTLVSCSTIQVGQNFKLQIFTQHAETGKTKKADVMKWLGKPMSTGVALKENGERLIEWDYFYATGNLPSMKNAKLKTLQVRFDNKGILRSYNWTGTK